MSDQQRSVIVPAKWFAFVPADSTHTAEWLDLYELRSFTMTPPGDNQMVQVVWKDGTRQKFHGDRAAHMDSQFALFRTQLPPKQVTKIS